MHVRYLLLLLFVFSATSQAQQKANDPIPLAHEGSDIATDSSVTWGILDNGMRYAILPNAEPPNRASLRLFVDAGSLMEKDNQQGLAHFLEHMAFNGTKNFPAGEMVEYFQRLGMGFGNHTNAHTSFHETVYKLELPNTEDKMLDEGFSLLRDYADGMLLEEKEIEDERGIILSEKRTRDSVGWRTFVEQINFAFPEHQLSKRMPIGTEEVIKNAGRDRFVEFYNDWYTPNRMAVIVVGDIEVAKVEGMIKQHLGAIPAREKTPTPEMGTVSKRRFATHYHYEEEAGETSVSIETLKERISPPDNKARRANDLRLMMASQMINRRLERIAKKKESPISAGRMHAGDFFDLGFAQYGSIEADCTPENWEAAMALVEQELRRALEHGFTDAELTETKANVLNQYENAAEQMATRKSRSLADQIASRIGNRRIFTSPKDDLPRVQSELETVTAEQCRNLLRELWDGSYEKMALVSGNAVIEDANNAIKSAYNASSEVAVTAPEEKELGAFAYADLPKAGKIADQKEVEDVGVTQIQFENGVRANLKITDFEDETIHVKARFGGGRLTETKEGLAFYTGSTFTGGGLEAHSNDELKQLFAGKSVSVGFGVENDAFTLAGRTNPEDLQQQMQLLRAYLTNPGYREESTTEFRRALDYMYQQLERTPGGYAQDKVARFLHSGDTRFGYPSREKVEAFTPNDAKTWLEKDLKTGYLEISLVGDFDKETAISVLAATVGNLPRRDKEKPAYSEERQVAFPEGTAEPTVFEFESEIPKGMTVVHWPTIDIFDIEKTRRIGMLGAILDDRLRKKIREELGDAYSPFAHNLPSDTWKDYGYLFATVTVDPKQAEKVATVIADIAKELATGTSITSDELERAKKPQVTQIEEMRRTNRYWMGSVMESSQEYPQRLEWSKTFVDDYKNITEGEVNNLAKEFLQPEKMVTVIVRPKAPEKE